MSKPTDPASLLAGLGLPAPPGSLYELALTHRSFAFERETPLPHNERLEFLGDAVLDLIVTDLIFKTRPEMAEGELAKLRSSVVNESALASVARAGGLGDHILLGRGEDASGGRDKDSLLSDTLEALVGATYLDRGLAAATEALVAVFGELIENSVAGGRGYDPKTALQEAVVRQRASRPSYRVASTGPDHDKRFVAHVYVEEELYGVGTGRSKKVAEQAAAREALDRLEQRPTDTPMTSMTSMHEETRSDARAS